MSDPLHQSQQPMSGNPIEPSLLSSPTVPSVNGPTKQRKLAMIAGAFVIVVVAIALFGILSHNQKPVIRPLAHTTVTIRITDSGFVPSDIFIKRGTQVVWTNETHSDQRIASDPYPSHTSLPGLFSDNIAPQATYAYAFEKSGHWGYQDFLHPTINGNVHVAP